MARVFCFKCKNCKKGFEYDKPSLAGEPLHYSCCSQMNIIRDYKAEGAQINIPAYMRSTASDKSEFLPNEKDFQSPEDPTGEKGMKAWKDDHVVKGSTWV